MDEWIDRYRAGEYAEVWAEMEAMGAAIAKPAHRKAAQKMVRETIDRAKRNVLHLFEELTGLGYQFRSETTTDHPLEIRIEHALEYAQKVGGPKFRANPWSHPALAWVDEEEVDVPVQFLKGKAALANYRPPTPRTKSVLDELERKSGHSLSLAARAWFEKVGSVDLKGTHPVLNPDGAVEILRITMKGFPIDGSIAGAEFVARLRHAFHWGGFPGWAGHSDPPEQELEYLRSQLEPL